MRARWMASPVCLVCLGVVAAGCTRSQAPKARLAGEVGALGGVAGIIASTLTVSVWSQAKTSIVVFSIVSGVGIVTYAVGELTDPANEPPVETMPERNRRWAKILTERAAGAAR